MYGNEALAKMRLKDEAEDFGELQIASADDIPTPFYYWVWVRCATKLLMKDECSEDVCEGLIEVCTG